MPAWRIVLGILLIGVLSLASLAVLLGPELYLARQAPQRRWAWVPSALLLILAGLTLGVLAAAQRAAGVPVGEQFALGMMYITVATWWVLSAVLIQFDRTLQYGRRLLGACLALALAFLCGMFVVGPRILKPREPRAQPGGNVGRYLPERAVQSGAPQNNELRAHAGGRRGHLGESLEPGPALVAFLQACDGAG